MALIKRKRLKLLFIFTGVLVAIPLFFFLIVYAGFFGKIPNSSELKTASLLESTTVYDIHNELIGKFFTENRTSVEYHQISPFITEFLVKIEDKRFYDHSGIDYYSLARVAVKTILLNNDGSGGGSTISQQLAKNLYPRRDFGFLYYPVNKSKEFIIASRLERLYTKEEILTLYLNTVSFGLDLYGIEAASNYFFDKPAATVNMQEAAMLVGMLKATTSYNPVIHYDRAIERRNTVLKLLDLNNTLKPEQADSLINTPLTISSSKKNSSTALYFLAEVKRETRKILQSHQKEQLLNLEHSGLKIYTTLDLEMQKMAEKAVFDRMKNLQAEFQKQLNSRFWDQHKELLNRELPSSSTDKSDKKIPRRVFNYSEKDFEELTVLDSIKHQLSFLQAGMLAADPTNGEIKTWVGGIDHHFFPFDQITASRQVGSTIKPFIYATALEQGISPCEYYETEAVTYAYKDEKWTPKNSSQIEDEKMTMQTAIEQSVNTVSVKILQDAGISTTIEYLRKAGLEGPIPEVPSIALGTPEISLYEMVEAYSSLANEGWRVPLHFITKIEDASGHVIYEYKQEAKTEVFSENTGKVMRYFLENVVNEGTASSLRTTYHINNSIGGKTGTTQQSADGWYMGISPHLVIGTRVGGAYPQIAFSSSKKGQGAYMALPIYAEFYKQLNKKKGFEYYTKASFNALDSKTLKSINCDPIKNEFKFLDWLFSRKNDVPTNEEINWEKASDEEKSNAVLGILKSIFRKKESNN